MTGSWVFWLWIHNESDVKSISVYSDHYRCYLVTKAMGIILGYAIVQWALHTQLNVPMLRSASNLSLFKRHNLLTLGYGDVTRLSLGTYH